MPGWYVLLTLLQEVLSENMSALTILTVFMDETKEYHLRRVSDSKTTDKRFTNNAANPYNSESKMTPFRVLHVAWPFRDDVCK